MRSRPIPVEPIPALDVIRLTRRSPPFQAGIRHPNCNRESFAGDARKAARPNLVAVERVACEGVSDLQVQLRVGRAGENRFIRRWWAGQSQIVDVSRLQIRHAEPIRQDWSLEAGPTRPTSACPPPWRASNACVPPPPYAPCPQHSFFFVASLPRSTHWISLKPLPFERLARRLRAASDQIRERQFAPVG